jgi:hypothetical protein
MQSRRQNGVHRSLCQHLLADRVFLLAQLHRTPNVQSLEFETFFTRRLHTVFERCGDLAQSTLAMESAPTHAPDMVQYPGPAKLSAILFTLSIAVFLTGLVSSPSYLKQLAIN